MRQNFNRIVENAVYHYRGTVWTRRYFLNIFKKMKEFPDLDPKRSGQLDKNFVPRLLKLLSKGPEKNFCCIFLCGEKTNGFLSFFEFDQSFFLISTIVLLVAIKNKIEK